MDEFVRGVSRPDGTALAATEAQDLTDLTALLNTQKRAASPASASS